MQVLTTTPHSPQVRALGAQSGALVLVLSAARGAGERPATEEPTAEPSAQHDAQPGAQHGAQHGAPHGALLLLCGCRPALRKARELVAAWNESTPRELVAWNESKPTDPTVVGEPRASCWAAWSESTPTDFTVVGEPRASCWAAWSESTPTDPTTGTTAATRQQRNQLS